MRQYIGYIRVSTAKQGEKGVSLQEQRDAIVRYAQRNSLSIIQWFEEKQTAAKRGRPIFSEMMKLLKRGKAAGLIVHKIDRSARNLKDWADLGELIDGGIEVHFANESLDLHSRGGRLSADIQAVVAADYIRNLREETRKGFYGRIKQGLYPLPAPLGYMDKGKGKPKEPDPVKAPLIKKTFELYASGAYNLERLVEEMFRLGLRNRRGGKVTMTGISNILNNPFYFGLIRLKRTKETFAGTHAPLVSTALFNKVQRVLTGRLNARTQRHDFLFRRMFHCRLCGYSLIGETKKGHVYYRCHTKTCPITCIREEAVEGVILEKLFPLHFTEWEEIYLRKKVAELKMNWNEDREKHVKSMQLHLHKMQERLDRLTDAYIDRLIEKEVFEARKLSLLKEKKGLEEKLDETQTGKRSLPDALSNFLELAGTAYVSYKMRLPEERRDLLERVTSNRSVEGKNVAIELKSPFQIVADHQKISYGAPYRDRPRTILDQLIKKLALYFSKEVEKGQGENDSGLDQTRKISQGQGDCV
jgi:DNA invertase Pin-like site-specific DNA recombinase